MRVTQSKHGFCHTSRWLGMALSALFLTACGGYQAPVTEQGEQQRVSAPIIVDSSTPESQFNAPSRAVVVSRPAARPTASRSSGVENSRPAASRSSRIENSRPVASAPVPAQIARTHRVRGGDTLFSIAFQYDLDFRRLAIANDLAAPYTIFVDQMLSLDLNNTNSSSGSAVNSNAGIAVSNNSVATARGAGRAGGVRRQPISASSSPASAPNWQWPHSGSILQGFGNGVNKGLDISGRHGDAVFAASDGDVVYSGNGIRGSGDLIILRHSDRYLSAYAHNSVMLVEVGRRVRAGEKIAEVGESPAGVSMLHFEIRLDGNSVDPAQYLPSR